MRSAVFIELAKYHPQGKRGVAIYLGANTDYEDVDAVQAMAHANANTLLGVIIETAQAVEKPGRHFAARH